MRDVTVLFGLVFVSVFVVAWVILVLDKVLDLGQRGLRPLVDSLVPAAGAAAFLTFVGVVVLFLYWVNQP